MMEREVTFNSAGLTLAGTLTLPQAAGAGPSPAGSPPVGPPPAGRMPVVLMIPGSGQVDRDENNKRLPINAFGELAGHLLRHGIASLRYDKRGVGESEGDFWTVGLSDNVADATAALGFLREQEELDPDKIFLVGHSEGAYIAMRVAAAAPDLAGAVFLAGGARSGEEELRWQGEQVAKSLTGFNAKLVKLLRIDVVKAQTRQIAKIKRSQKDWYRVQLVAKVNAKWMREFLDYDPSVDLSAMQVPILAITGSKDVQVDPANLERMAALVKAPLEYHVLPDVTHLLRSDPGPPGLSSYKKQVRRPIDPRLVELVLAWLERQIG